MKKITNYFNIILVAFIFSLFIGCEKDDNVNYGPESINELTIKYTPDPGTSSVSYFYCTYNNDYSCSGYNNEASYPGVVWSYDGGTTINLSYTDGGKETIAFTSETRYKYKGTTASGYSESHDGSWQLLNVNSDDDVSDEDENIEGSDQYVCIDEELDGITFMSCSNGVQHYYEFNGKKYWCTGVDDCNAAAAEMIEDMFGSGVVLEVTKEEILQHLILLNQETECTQCP